MKTEEEIREFIKNIPTDVRNMSYDELVIACNIHFPRIPILPLKFNNEPFFFGQHDLSGKNAVYRGRKITNKENQPHKKVSDISYIPDTELHVIKEFGRVNKKGESMFYGAFHYPTASFETLSKGVDFRNLGSGMVSVGTWLINERLKIVQLPPSKKYWNKLNAITTFDLVKSSDAKIDEEISIIKSLVEKEIDYEILELFGDAFANFEIECEQDYYLSNYYKDRIFNKILGFKVPEEYDAIIYASVPNANESDNIVIKPEAVDKKMKFMDAMQVWVVHHKQTTESMQFIPIVQKIYAEEDGILKWNR
nr:hypothetical protein [uncultured Flavobacterium sp.]